MAKKKLIDMIHKEFGKKDEGKHYIVGAKDEDVDANVLLERDKVGDEVAQAIEYNESLLDFADRYLKLVPWSRDVVLVRHRLYVPQSRHIIMTMPTVTVVDDSKPMNKKAVTIRDPFPFTNEAVVVAAHPESGLVRGDMVIVSPPYKKITLHSVGFDGLFIAPGGNYEEALGYWGNTEDYGYRLISTRDIHFKVKG